MSVDYRTQAAGGIRICFLLFCCYHRVIDKLGPSGNSGRFNSLTEDATLDVDQFLWCL